MGALLSAPALVALGVAMAPAGAQAEALTPHVVKPDVVTPHVVAQPPAADPPADDPSAEPPSPDLRAPAVPPGPTPPPTAGSPGDEAPPTFIRCDDPNLPCPLTPRQLEELKERQKQEAERLARDAKELKELRDKYLAEHPPTVIEILVGQLLCPLYRYNWRVLSNRIEQTRAAGLTATDELWDALHWWEELVASRACITFLEP